MAILYGGDGIQYPDGSMQTSAPTPSLISISASVSANAITVSCGELNLDFRNTVLTNGAVSRVRGTPANLVIAATDSFGAVTAGGTQRIAILVINAAGTMYLAASNLAGGISLDETGVITTATTATTATAIKTVGGPYGGVAYRVVGFVDVPFTTAVGYGAIVKVQGQGGQALAAMSSLGYGQTWQNVTGSRAAATTYYNTTGKPIGVTVAVSTGTNTGVAITVNGVALTQVTNTAGQQQASYAVIPVGGSYSATLGAGAAILTWHELR